MKVFLSFYIQPYLDQPIDSLEVSIMLHSTSKTHIFRVGIESTSEREIFAKGIIQSKCISLFMSHNETVNVWTHLLGIIILLVLVGYIVGGTRVQ